MYTVGGQHFLIRLVALENCHTVLETGLSIAAMSAPSGHDELVAEFIGITNAPASEAEHMLEATGWDLDTAVQLHFEGQGAATATTSTPAPARMPDELPDLDDFMDEARGSRAAAALAAAAPMVGEDGVRVADSVKRERLFDTRHARQPRVSISHAAPEVQQMPFGDLDPDAAKRTGPGLDSIYQPPKEILSSLQLPEYAFVQLSCSFFMFRSSMRQWSRRSEVKGNCHYHSDTWQPRNGESSLQD